MEKDFFLKSIIRVSIDGFLAGYGRVRNKKSILLLENALKKILGKYSYDKELITKTYFEVLSDFDKKGYKLYQGFYKINL
ncbi:hypothetical protein EOM39_05355 [Candidatus Gracilibacteria bacterium]|nr:hypothetical protein [Candidatus Gracilibacteria bacterium]